MLLKSMHNGFVRTSLPVLSISFKTRSVPGGFPLFKFLMLVSISLSLILTSNGPLMSVVLLSIAGKLFST